MDATQVTPAVDDLPGEVRNTPAPVRDPRDTGGETVVLAPASLAAEPATEVFAAWRDASSGYEALVQVDLRWYEGQQTTHRPPQDVVPVVVPVTAGVSLIGRPSSSRGITPEIDCSADPGVSRRHAQLTHDETGWYVEDLGSSNGTFVAGAGEPLPDVPLAPMTPRLLRVGDQIFVGAWTRIEVRRVGGPVG